MIFDPPSRSRRRIWGRLIWPLLVVIAVILAVVVSAAGEETRTELDYLGRLHDQSTELARSGDALRDVVFRLQRIDRTEFVTVIEGIRADLAEGLELTAQEPPVASLVPVRALYSQALGSWDRGVEAFSAAVLEAADEPESVVAVDNMAGALAELRAGDDAYRHMVEAMQRDDVPEPLSPMPAVTMMPAEGTLVGLSVSYVDSARSEGNELALRPGLAVSMVTASPEWEVSPEGGAVMPATSTVVFSVVVSNVGNVASEPEALVLEMLGGTETVRLTADVASLRPDQQVTLLFEELDVEPGGVYQVRAALSITGGDVSFDDNAISVEFAVNEE